MTTTSTTPTLEWLRRLPEVGALARSADKEGEMLERLAGLREQIAAVESRLGELRADAEQQAARDWTADEIRRAKEQP